MAVRLTCVDNASGHDGLRWRMGPDSENVDIVVGETPPGVGELIVNAPIEPEACFSVVAFAGEEESEAAEVCADFSPDYSSASIGDEIGGGIYGGTHTNGTEVWHLIFAKQDGELAPGSGSRWATSNTAHGGVDDDDGQANQSAVEGYLDAVPAHKYCHEYQSDGFDDWYLPARNELIKIHDLVQIEHPDFILDTTVNRWSSTEYGTVYAWRIRPSDGAAFNNITKTSTSYRVRPVRRVPV